MVASLKENKMITTQEFQRINQYVENCRRENEAIKAGNQQRFNQRESEFLDGKQNLSGYLIACKAFKGTGLEEEKAIYRIGDKYSNSILTQLFGMSKRDRRNLVREMREM
jgi:hypothetical protein